MKEYKGKLNMFFETGCEGVMFVLYEDNFKGYEAIRYIEPWDHLTIIDEEDNVVFSGKLNSVLSHEAGPDNPLTLVSEENFFARWEEFPMNPGHGQLCLNGYWVHWLPTNVDLKLWYDVFLGQEERYTGILKQDIVN